MIRRSLIAAVIFSYVAFFNDADARNGAEITSWGPKAAPGVKTEATAYLPAQSRGTGPKGTAAVGDQSASQSAPPVRILPLSCLGSSAGGDGIVVSLNQNSCVAAAAEAPRTLDPDDPLPSPLELAWMAADRAMSFAEWPQLRVAPSRVGLTGLPSFFWLERRPPPVTASAAVPGMTVTALAEPVEFRWDFGDGSGRTTSHAGRAWTRKRDGNIGHVYERRGPRAIGVEVVWQARWRIDGGGWRHLGYFSNHDSRSYRVRQMVAMLSRTRRR